jgi:hypothetical protein
MRDGQVVVTTRAGDNVEISTELATDRQNSKDRAHAYLVAGLILAIISAIITLLQLLHDSGAWPYGGPSWMWPALGAALTIAGTALVSRNARLITRSAKIGLSLALIGAVTTTSTIQDFTTSTDQGAPRLSITSPQDKQYVDGSFTLYGTFVTPPRAGESIWVAAGPLPPDGGDPTFYALRPGPCTISLDVKRWSCDVNLANDGPRQVKLFILAARGQRTVDLTRRLTEGSVFDYKNNNPQKGPDPRNFDALPIGEDFALLDTVVVGMHS